MGAHSQGQLRRPADAAAGLQNHAKANLYGGQSLLSCLTSLNQASMSWSSDDTRNALAVWSFISHTYPKATATGNPKQALVSGSHAKAQAALSAWPRGLAWASDFRPKSFATAASNSLESMLSMPQPEGKTTPGSSQHDLYKPNIQTKRKAAACC